MAEANGPPEGARFELGQDGERQVFPCTAVMTVGRDKNSHIRLADSSVSRNHAVVRQLGRGDFYLMDSGSTNGSFVNEKRVTLPVRLRNSDRVRVGDTALVFYQEEEAAAEQLDMTQSSMATMVVQRPILKEITILVSDIRSFTPMTEQIPINELTDLMAQWFHEVTESISDNNGQVDKFIGDCVYARWETGEDACGSVCNALKSARRLNRISSTLNQKFPDLPAPLKIGVGINCGEAAVDFGRESTAIGDAVNLAFRLESSSKEMGKDVVLSRNSYRHLPDSMWQGRETSIMVKGKKDPVEVCGFSFAEIEEFLEEYSPSRD